MLDPVEYRDEVVAARLTWDDVTGRVHVADSELLVESAEVEYCNDTVSASHHTCPREHLRVSMKIWIE